MLELALCFFAYTARITTHQIYGHRAQVAMTTPPAAVHQITLSCERLSQAHQVRDCSVRSLAKQQDFFSE